MNIARSTMNNSIILVARHNKMINSENMIKNWMENILRTEPSLLGRQTEMTGRRQSCWRSAAADVADDGSPRRLTWTKDEPWWKSRSSRAGCFPKTLFVLSQCRISRTEVTETCSPDRRCTPTLGMDLDYDGGTTARKRQNSSFCNPNSVL